MTSPLDPIRSVLLGESRWAVVNAKWQDVLPQMDNGCVAHVICDPPYSEHVHSKSRAGARKVPLKDGNGRISRCAIDREVDFGFECISSYEVGMLAAECVRIARRWSIVFCDVESVRQWMASMESVGMAYKRTCAWVKLGGTPQFSGDRPGVGFEAIPCFHHKGRSRWNGGGKLGVYSHLTCIERGGKSCKNDKREHPTQKPLPLMLDLIADFTSPGDVVLDPFCGSGTTGVACLRLGRRFVGVEMQACHVETAVNRLTAEERDSTSEALRAGQLSLLGRSA